MANEFRVKNGLATANTVVINSSGSWVGQPIANNKLENDGISINGQRVSLGGSVSVDSFPLQTGQAGRFLKSNGTSAYWADIDGENWTSGSAPPESGNEVGDKWYDTTNNVLYEYVDDGSSSYWLDVSGPTVASPAGITPTFESVTITGEPTSSTDAATKAYVDSAVASADGGGTYLTRTYTVSEGAQGPVNAFIVSAGCTVDNVLVFQNGVCQEPTTDYIISGTSLTFTETPVIGVRIQIRELPR